VADFSVAGTYKYSPPEVLDGARLSFSGLTKADVYSATIVIVELLTEKEPFKALNPHQIRKAVTSGDRPSTKGNGGEQIPRELRALLEKGWTKHPAERPSAVLMLQEFTKISLDDGHTSYNSPSRDSVLSSFTTLYH
jgi:hypothetical protein